MDHGLCFVFVYYIGVDFVSSLKSSGEQDPSFQQEDSSTSDELAALEITED